MNSQNHPEQVQIFKNLETIAAECIYAFSRSHSNTEAHLRLLFVQLWAICIMQIRQLKEATFIRLQ